jgi:hypothetical protein
MPSGKQSQIDCLDYLERCATSSAPCAGSPVVRVRFEWDALKATSNFRKHDVSFDEAASVFFDPLSATGNDRIIRSMKGDS